MKLKDIFSALGIFILLVAIYNIFYFVEMFGVIEYHKSMIHLFLTGVLAFTGYVLHYISKES